MKRNCLKKYLSLVIILVTFMSSELLASQILARYKGNESLRYLGTESEVGKVITDDNEDEELTDAERKIIDELLNAIHKKFDTTRYVYEVGNTEARFSTNIKAKDKDTVAILNFGERTYYKIWWDEIEYKPQKNEINFGTLYLTTPGKYVVLVSNEDGKGFFNKYARYEFEIGTGFIFEAQIKKEGFACTYNESTGKYVYQYNDKKFLQSTIPFGYTSSDPVEIEFTDYFILQHIYHNGEELYTNSLEEIKTKKFYEQGYYEIIGGTYSSENTETTEVKFNFEIGPNILMNDEVFVLPSGLKLKKIYLDNKEIDPKFINKQVLFLKDDGNYELEYVLDSWMVDSEADDQTKADESAINISTKSAIDNKELERYKINDVDDEKNEYQKYIEKVNLKQSIIKNSDSNHFHFDQEFVDNSVVKQISVIVDKSDLELKLYKAGLEIPYNSFIDEPGWYTVVAIDKYGNKQKTKFRINLSKSNIVNNILVVAVLLLVFIYLKKRRERNYGKLF